MKAFRHLFLLLCVLFCTQQAAFATHNRAGEITYRQIAEFTFEATVTTYTHTGSPAADRESVELIWGDGTSDIVERASREDIGNQIWKNRYVARHTYIGPGTYILRFLDPNRIADIKNMSNSVNVMFYIETQLTISGLSGTNNSPLLLQDPIDFACTRKIYKHNPNAFDPDGDSLIFTLIPPKQDIGRNVPGYSTPPGSFILDRFTGELVWNTPMEAGIYNIAILIEEYRNGRRIGYVTRDMQIIVNPCNNNPPVLQPVADTCVEAGKNIVLQVPVSATDPDAGDRVTITASGGPFIQRVFPATFTDPNGGTPVTGIQAANGIFRWQIDCQHITKYPWRVVFRAVDNNEPYPLADLEHFDIRVVGPAPENLELSPLGNGVQLNWQKPVCGNVRGYFVYRRVDSSGYTAGYCNVGVPPETGYRRIATLQNPNQLSYFDNSNGAGLAAGIRYCYIVTAVYLNENQYEYTEGYPSNETCAMLKKDVPILTHVSVDSTSATHGQMFVQWSKPTELDTLVARGPYRYVVTRAVPGEEPQTVQVIGSDWFGTLNDSSITDHLLNTSQVQYTYRVGLYFTFAGQDTFAGAGVSASSIFLRADQAHHAIDLSWTATVPWTNTKFDVYRRAPGEPDFTLYATVSEPRYRDTVVELGHSYCYKVQAHGSYFSDKFTDPLLNWSQSTCQHPTDTIPPCPPTLTAANPDCDAYSTTLNWFYDPECGLDAVEIRLYFSPRRTNNFGLVEVFDINGTMYRDIKRGDMPSLAGCYTLTAIDSFGNESIFGDTMCVDNCEHIYRLPNIITPNGDEFNDVFRPFPDMRFIEWVDITIFNRWGQPVFQTNDPWIGWDGTDQKTGEPLADGQYYYIGIGRGIRLDFSPTFRIRGNITIAR